MNHVNSLPSAPAWVAGESALDVGPPARDRLYHRNREGPPGQDGVVPLSRRLGVGCGWELGGPEVMEMFVNLFFIFVLLEVYEKVALNVIRLYQ